MVEKGRERITREESNPAWVIGTGRGSEAVEKS